MTESSDSNKTTDETISINSNDENHSTAANDLKPENDNDLQLQIEKLTQEKEDSIKAAEEHKDNYIRGKAEVANIQLRSQQEILKAKQFGTQNLIKALLPVLDSLEKGIEACSEAENKEGLELTLSLLLDVLSKEGVEAVKPEKLAFDPKFHEAISIENNKDIEKDIVIRVLQTGYKLKDRSLRAALVVVNK